VDVRPVFIKDTVYYNLFDFKHDTYISDKKIYRMHVEKEKETDASIATPNLDNKLVVLANSCADPAFFKDRAKRNTFINNFNILSTSDVLHNIESYMSLPTILTIVKLLANRVAGGK
jgi:hypothetical protein